jgi:hypothetical protein
MAPPGHGHYRQAHPSCARERAAADTRELENAIRFHYSAVPLAQGL